MSTASSSIDCEIKLTVNLDKAYLTSLRYKYNTYLIYGWMNWLTNSVWFVDGYIIYSSTNEKLQYYHRCKTKQKKNYIFFLLFVLLATCLSNILFHLSFFLYQDDCRTYNLYNTHVHLLLLLLLYNVKYNWFARSYFSSYFLCIFFFFTLLLAFIIIYSIYYKQRREKKKRNSIK